MLKGTVVHIASYTTHRDASVYGEDIEAFRPERVRLSVKDKSSQSNLDVQWERETAQMKEAYIPFSVGSRSCPGRNVAIVKLRQSA